MNGILFFIIGFGLFSGFILFRKNTIPFSSKPVEKDGRISIIIPARNEERNLPFLLNSLEKQTLQPDEIIVVDDHSEDRTIETAQGYGVHVITLSGLPEGWTGKTWAVWNGYLRSSGDCLVFLDADIRLEPDALRALITERKRVGGVLSVVPYHTTERFYERLAMIPNILGIFAFTSPFERNNVNKGLYGSCIVTTREDYEKIGGHESIKSEMLDDLNLGGKFQRAGIPVVNFIGKHAVSFRMYPNGLKSELEGFAKGAILSTSSLDVRTLLFITLWILGLLMSETFPFFIHTAYGYPLLVGYLLYVIQILLINRYVGRFGMIHPLFHFLSMLFFFIVLLYSFYQAIFRKSVLWKGRYIQVGRRISK